MSPAVTAEARHAATAAPLSAVLAQVRTGAPSLAVIAQRTGLPLDLVRLAVDRLVATGHLAAEPLDSSCPTSGCGTCPSASGSGAGSATCAPGARRGAPVLLRLGTGPRT